jgi:DNA modification methylase
MRKTFKRQQAVAGAAEPDKLIVGHAASVMAGMPEGSVDLIVTSPPYWTAVEYDGGERPWRSYEEYLADIETVWGQCARVLRPNGKLCINAPVMPIPKDMIRQHTRHLKNIAADMEHCILAETELERYALFV